MHIYKWQNTKNTETLQKLKLKKLNILIVSKYIILIVSKTIIVSK